MKNEELLELLSELKINDEYIEEALTDEPDPQGIRVYAVKKHVTPAKIIAPIAACLAIAVGVRVAVSNINMHPAPYTESTSHSGPIQAIGTPTPEKLAFIEECKEIISNECELISQNETVWNTRLINITLEGEDDFLIYPQINGETVDGVGVRVFGRDIDGKALDLGSFGEKSDNIDITEIFRDPDRKPKFYYCYFSFAENGRHYDRVQKIFYDSIKKEIYTETYLEKAVTASDGTLGSDDYSEFYSSYDNKRRCFITRAEYLRTVRTLPYIEKALCTFTSEEIEECEKSVLTMNGLEEFIYQIVPSSAWNVNEIDINEDGKDELLLSMYDYVDLNGVFVFAKNGGAPEYVGSFDTDEGLCNPEIIKRYSSPDEKFWYYESVDTSKQELHKIICGDGELYTETIISYMCNPTSGYHYWWIGTEEVSYSEYAEEKKKYFTGSAVLALNDDLSRFKNTPPYM